MTAPLFFAGAREMVDLPIAIPLLITQAFARPDTGFVCSAQTRKVQRSPPMLIDAADEMGSALPAMRPLADIGILLTP